jgi:hypothetical protein
LNTRIEAIATRRGISLSRQERNWYRWDPLHILPQFRRAAFERFVLASVGHGTPLPSADEPRRLSRHSTVNAHFSVPAERRVFGLRQRRRQPSVYLDDGSRIGFY